MWLAKFVDEEHNLQIILKMISGHWPLSQPQCSLSSHWSTGVSGQKISRLWIWNLLNIIYDTIIVDQNVQYINIMFESWCDLCFSTKDIFKIRLQSYLLANTWQNAIILKYNMTHWNSFHSQLLAVDCQYDHHNLKSKFY